MRARSGQIIICDSAYQQIKDSFKCREVGEITLKNKQKPMMVYEVISWECENDLQLLFTYFP